MAGSRILIGNLFFLLVKCQFPDKLHFGQRVVVSDTYNLEPVIRRALSGVSVNQCIEECKGRQFCDYVNYHARAYVCYIIQSGQAPTTVEDTQYVYARHEDLTLVCT